MPGSAAAARAVVAADVRRLSTESGDTGKRIGDQVSDFGSRLHEALTRAAQHTDRDAGVNHASELTINEVVEQVDGAVSALNERAAELAARAEAVRAQVEQLVVAFQLQDRVHQIMDQVAHSIAQGVSRLQQAFAAGAAPGAEEWAALLSADYSTDEQRAVGDSAHTGKGSTPAASASSSSDTTFF